MKKLSAYVKPITEAIQQKVNESNAQKTADSFKNALIKFGVSSVSEIPAEKLHEFYTEAGLNVPLINEQEDSWLKERREMIATATAKLLERYGVKSREEVPADKMDEFQKEMHMIMSFGDMRPAPAASNVSEEQLDGVAIPATTTSGALAAHRMDITGIKDPGAFAAELTKLGLEAFWKAGNSPEDGHLSMTDDNYNNMKDDIMRMSTEMGFVVTESVEELNEDWKSPSQLNNGGDIKGTGIDAYGKLEQIMISNDKNGVILKFAKGLVKVLIKESLKNGTTVLSLGE